MSGKEMRFQDPPKTFRLNSWITQRIREWVPNSRTGDWESPQVPNVLRRNRRIFSLRRMAERRCWRSETSETGTQQLAMYLGARYRRHRWTVTASFYCTQMTPEFSWLAWSLIIYEQCVKSGLLTEWKWILFHVICFTAGFFYSAVHFVWKRAIMTIRVDWLSLSITVTTCTAALLRNHRNAAV